MEKPYIEKTTVTLVGNPNYPQDAKCAAEGCGHSYGRHFDSYEDDPYDPPIAGCKYCPCTEFIEVSLKQGDVIYNPADSSWEMKVLGISREHNQLWAESFPRKHMADPPKLRPLTEIEDMVKRGAWAIR